MSRTPRSYFERLYGQEQDPWGLDSRWYERRKYALTMAVLPDARYRRAFEVGCSIGVLTEQLASRCDSVIAADLMPGPVEAARRRTAGLPGVTVECRCLPEEWPDGPFDLLVLSEVAYYFDADELRRLLDVATRSLDDAATVVAVHWRGETDYPVTGDETHAILSATLGLHGAASYREDAFALDVWSYRRTGGSGTLN